MEALEPEIKKLAMRWSKDSPDDWEDLAQEARLAIYQELKDKPDSPRRHLFRRAKHEILDARKKGKSVDGRRHKTFKRRFVWALVSLDVDLDGALTAEASLYFHTWQTSPVEDMAITKVVCGELQRLLTTIENSYLSLLLQGYRHLEANALLGLNAVEGYSVRRSIREKARDILSDAEPPVTRGAIVL